MTWDGTKLYISKRNMHRSTGGEVQPAEHLLGTNPTLNSIRYDACEHQLWSTQRYCDSWFIRTNGSLHLSDCKWDVQQGWNESFTLRYVFHQQLLSKKTFHWMLILSFVFPKFEARGNYYFFFLLILVKIFYKYQINNWDFYPRSTVRIL